MDNKEKATRIVELIGQLVELTATPIDLAPQWKVGDRAFIEVEVVRDFGDKKYVEVALIGVTGPGGFIRVPANILEAVDD